MDSLRRYGLPFSKVKTDKSSWAGFVWHFSFVPCSFLEEKILPGSLLYTVGLQLDPSWHAYKALPLVPCVHESEDPAILPLLFILLLLLRAARPPSFITSCLMLLLHIPASENFSCFLINSYKTCEGCVHNILCSISVFGRFSISLVHPNIENRSSGTFP